MTPLTAIVLARPNALDREVSAISAHALLTRPPFDLIDPARAAAAGHLEQTQLLLWIAALLLQIGTLAWFWSSGQSARLRDLLRLRAPSEFWARFTFAAILALVDKSVALLPQAMQYRFLRIMGMTELLFRQWLAEWLAGTLLAMLVAGAIAAIVLWLVDRTHQWYVYTLAAIMGATLLCGFAAPFVTSPPFEPAVTSRTVGAELDALRARTRVGAPLVEQRLVSRTRVSLAYVAGIGSSQRMVVSDTLIAGATAGEMRFVIARLMAWVENNAALHLALIQGGMLVLGAALAVAISDRIGFRRDDDPVSRLALLGAIMGVVYFAALPFYNSYSRNLDIAVDRTAVAITGDRVSAIRLEVRRADQALLSACPASIARWYLMPHPSPGERISMFQNVPDACASLRP
jgi:Zn-dependent protease with chaperone function